MDQIEQLIQQLNDMSPERRWEACETLGELGDVRAVEPLLQRLGGSYGYVRRAACEALGKLGDPRAIEPLVLRAIVETEPEVLDAINSALTALGDATPEQVLHTSPLQADDV